MYTYYLNAMDAIYKVQSLSLPKRCHLSFVANIAPERPLFKLKLQIIGRGSC